MAEGDNKAAMKPTKASKGFTDEERAAMKAARPGAEGEREQGGRGTRPAREDRRDAGA